MPSEDVFPEIFPSMVGALEAANPETGMVKIAGIDTYLHPTLVGATRFQVGEEVRHLLKQGPQQKMENLMVVQEVRSRSEVVVATGKPDVNCKQMPYFYLKKVWRVHPWHENHLRGGVAPGTQVACSSLTGPGAVHNGAEGKVTSVVNARGRQRVQLQNCETYFRPENLVPLDDLFQEPFHSLKQVYSLDKWYCHGRNHAGGCRGPHGGSAIGGPIGQPRFQCLDRGCDFNLCKDCYELKSPPKVYFDCFEMYCIELSCSFFHTAFSYSITVHNSL